MKKRIAYLGILVIPFLAMVLLNEFVRYTIKEEGANRKNIVAINFQIRNKEKCTWICHDDTNYCKENHVKLLNEYYDYVDPFYFGIIKALKSSGNYSIANIVFLVVLIPGLLYFLLIQSIEMQREINFK